VVVRVLKAAIVRNLAEHEDEELEGTYDDYEDTGHADHEDTDHPDPEERAD